MTIKNTAPNKGLGGGGSGSGPDKTTTVPLVNGTAAIGNENKYADGKHVHPTDTSRASQSQVDAMLIADNVAIIVATKAVLTAYPTTGINKNDMAVVVADETQGGQKSYYLRTGPGNGNAWTYQFSEPLKANAQHLHVVADITDLSLEGGNARVGRVLSVDEHGIGTGQLIDENGDATGDYVQNIIMLGTDAAEPPIPQKSTSLPLPNGTAAIGGSNTYADGLHVHPTDATRIGEAPLDGKQYARKDAAWEEVTGGGGPSKTTTTPQQDGTAAIGNDTGWAAGDHVHPANVGAALPLAWANTALAGSSLVSSRQDHQHPTWAGVFGLTSMANTTPSSANYAINYTTGLQTHRATLTQNTTIALNNFTNSATSNTTIELWIVMGATAYTVTWPTITWLDGTAPTIPANKTSVITLRYYAGTWIGNKAYEV